MNNFHADHSTYIDKKMKPICKDENGGITACCNSFTYRILQELMFHILSNRFFCEANPLGKGSFGSVYRGKLSDGTGIAVKVFNSLSERATKSFYAECKILSNIRHPNITKIISCCSNTDFKSLVLIKSKNWTTCCKETQEIESKNN